MAPIDVKLRIYLVPNAHGHEFDIVWSVPWRLLTKMVGHPLRTSQERCMQRLGPYSRARVPTAVVDDDDKGGIARSADAGPLQDIEGEVERVVDASVTGFPTLA